MQIGRGGWGWGVGVEWPREITYPHWRGGGGWLIFDLLLRSPSLSPFLLGLGLGHEPTTNAPFLGHRSLRTLNRGSLLLYTVFL